ncbi:hypothetical protein llap_2279 [Limosa lapponica baueri]|uniref:Uncharacterized protein n=1 Tax=Limosa lapponica baueri TaxID=1758121 RepID=A0A2I0UN14_LIMLA|nr:hypothetical protein llap_2279 [Limosa lapponica baueri]
MLNNNAFPEETTKTKERCTDENVSLTPALFLSDALIQALPSVEKKRNKIRNNKKEEKGKNSQKKKDKEKKKRQGKKKVREIEGEMEAEREKGREGEREKGRMEGRMEGRERSLERKKERKMNNKETGRCQTLLVALLGMAGPDIHDCSLIACIGSAKAQRNLFFMV